MLRSVFADSYRLAYPMYTDYASAASSIHEIGTKPLDTPLYVTASVVSAGTFAAVATPIVLRRSTRGARLPSWNAVAVGGALAVWFVAAAILALAGAIRPAEGEVVPPIGIALMLALSGLALALAILPRLRAVLAHPRAQSALVGLQIWRIEGLAFLVLMALGQLPALFAIPAGLGDLAIGLTAPLMARNLHRRRLAIGWNLFGLADLVVAVALGATASPGAAQLFLTTPSAEAMTAFPMALIPTFLVPLSIGLHLVSLRYLLSRRGRTVAAPDATRC